MPSDADSKEYIRTGIFPIGKQGQDFEGSKVVSARYYFDWLSASPGGLLFEWVGESTETFSYQYLLF